MQIRNVPPEVSRVMKTRAAAGGQTLSDYLLTEITKLAQRPTIDQMSERIARLGRTQASQPADVLAQARSER